MIQNCEKSFLRGIFRLTFFKTRFARYKKVKLVKCPISRHILAKNEKFTSKMISHSFESLTIKQITNMDPNHTPKFVALLCKNPKLAHPINHLPLSLKLKVWLILAKIEIVN